MLELNDEDKRIIAECLRAASEGPFFPDWEFPSLMGAEREEVKQLLDKIPNIDWNDDQNKTILINCLNNILGYPHQLDVELGRYLSVDIERVEGIIAKIR